LQSFRSLRHFQWFKKYFRSFSSKDSALPNKGQFFKSIFGGLFFVLEGFQGAKATDKQVVNT